MKAYKYRGGIGVFTEEGESVFERDVRTLYDNKIYAPHKDALNDPAENLINDAPFRKFLKRAKMYKIENIDVAISAYKLFCKTITKHGVYSMSRNYSNELLWAYYGGGHRGFCIEYDVDILLNSWYYSKSLRLDYDFNVEYSSKIPIYDGNYTSEMVQDDSCLIRKFIGTKSHAWKHEEEYRLVLNEIGLIDIDYRAVTAIYFGCKMEDREIDFIMNKLRGRGIEYYKMMLNKNSYTLKSVSIEDVYFDSPAYVPHRVICRNWFLNEGFMGKTYKYKNKLLEALEIVKEKPEIKQIDFASIKKGKKLTLEVIARVENTLEERKFRFVVRNDGSLERIGVN